MQAADLARLLLLAGLWGGAFAFIRVAVPALGPLWLAFSRVALAFLALFALALVRRAVPSFRAHWRDYIFIGVVNSALPFALFCFAEQYVGAAVAAILNATSPFFAAAVAALWLKETLSRRTLGGMALGFVGVMLIVGWSPHAPSPISQRGHPCVRPSHRPCRSVSPRAMKFASSPETRKRLLRISSGEAGNRIATSPAAGCQPRPATSSTAPAIRSCTKASAKGIPSTTFL